ncbi:SRPBCC family protein [Actinoallomurus sp. NBC_01490]|uniref:SRPBCC family protein n=1 Tax=Actinoallomurus sp. NBC_01490 TaxID=2903557 RepID=UPI002E379D2E|nr:SRPBCC family protein [Actinoallomurus sp. NBC_01490]
MRLRNAFQVPTSIDTAWEVLTDIPRLAPCMPGARLDEPSGGGEFTGAVKVRVGPIGVEYRGTARVLERDDAGRRMVVEGRARDVRGQGDATAVITLTAREESGTTMAEVVTDLDISGRIAQFGRGALEQVSGRLVEEFAGRLRAEVTGGTPPPPAADAVSLRTLLPGRPSPAALRYVAAAAATAAALAVLAVRARRGRR